MFCLHGPPKTGSSTPPCPPSQSLRHWESGLERSFPPSRTWNLACSPCTMKPFYRDHPPFQGKLAVQESSRPIWLHVWKSKIYTECPLK
ncbi:hypothetical protein AVEN_225544-1 [Araneus ventricosus]|uniref:Uncharacterized protein n=1 Tax=Araneus ventricosus TaxID=182803 RepID=A0A4Y2L616_ARAVE|nr:hypothetical protein AVEN_225544-1 [Araneus ventricosus]